jgi:hypothetical protein
MDGVRFGHHCDNPKDLEDLYLRSRTEGFGEEVKRKGQRYNKLGWRILNLVMKFL